MEAASDNISFEPLTTVTEEDNVVIVVENDLQTHSEEKMNDLPQTDMLRSQCFSCGVYIGDEKSLIDHFKFHFISKPFQQIEVGYECNKMKENSPNYLYNLAKNKYLVQCPLCNFFCSKKFPFIKHVLDSHSHGSLVCVLCKELATTRVHFASHILGHSKKWKPSIDPVNNDDNQITQNDPYLSSSHEGKALCCKFCTFKTRSQIYFDKHLLQHSFKRFHCSFCTEQFIEKQGLMNHYIYLHTDEKPFSCHHCKKSFKKFGALCRHKLIHSAEKPFNCSHCNYVCKRKDNLKSHLLVHFKSTPFMCKECNYTAKTKGALKQHYLVHATQRLHSCSLCFASFKSKASLNRHSQIHITEKPLSCSLCHFTCRNEAQLKSHMIRHSESKLFRCEICNRDFKRKPSLLRHLGLHANEKNLVCSFCNFSCKNQDNLQKHLLLHGPHETNHLIDRYNPVDSLQYDDSERDLPSNITFEFPKEMNNEPSSVDVSTNTDDYQSLILDDQLTDSPHFCEVRNMDSVEDELTEITISLDTNSCFQEQVITNINFPRNEYDEYDLNFEKKFDFRHYSIGVPKRRECSKCGFECRTKKELKEHFSSQHGNIKPYRCFICDREFKLKANLKQHSVIHSQDKPFHCHLCQYKCKLRETLKRHYVVHSDEKPFQCNLCNYKCKLKEKLKMHYFVHSLEKPFHCDLCSYACKTKELLKKHSLVHNRKKLG